MKNQKENNNLKLLIYKKLIQTKINSKQLSWVNVVIITILCMVSFFVQDYFLDGKNAIIPIIINIITIILVSLSLNIRTNKEMIAFKDRMDIHKELKRIQVEEDMKSFFYKNQYEKDYGLSKLK